jgi:hypothetical protein
MLNIKIISGGQTGVDRAGLDMALELGLDCGGWCPKGRMAEDGPIPAKYALREMPSPKYPPRTEKNGRASDGTLILTWGPVTGGTSLTVKLARKHRKRYIVVNLSYGGEAQEVRDWIRIYNIKILNVAGPRESKKPGIHDFGVVKWGRATRTMLLPQEHILDSLKEITAQKEIKFIDLIDLAKEFGVSTEAVLRRLVNLNKVNKNLVNKILVDSDQFYPLPCSFSYFILYPSKAKAYHMIDFLHKLHVERREVQHSRGD